jgi:hypothetical protein
MKLISHRGNLTGADPLLENHPDYIRIALDKGYDVEVDVWACLDSLYLGHDKPLYKIDFAFFLKYKKFLWIHCKNTQAISVLISHQADLLLNFFWHENDAMTFTSLGYLWAYVGVDIPCSIALLPESYSYGLQDKAGICSDRIVDF